MELDLINRDEVLSNARKSPGSLGRPFWLIYSTLRPCLSLGKESERLTHEAKPSEARATEACTRISFIRITY